MKIKSFAFEDNQFIPHIYSCDGDNISPPLNIIAVPENTKSLALIMDDPDAPNGPFTHWLLWDLPPHDLEIAENSVPEGAVQGLNSAGKTGYHGPCPPQGIHHYRFKLYALNRDLEVSQNISRQQLEAEIEGITIEKAELVGLYKRK